jgi:3-hydroxyacyl-CoA dehydrogenase/enoyl-CoA hydratase/3-hydroxybutyryl-CoA epimerase
MPSLTTTLEGSTAVLTLDLAGEPVNKLSADVKREFEDALARLREDAAVRAVVLISGKSDTFIAGADIEEFTRLSTLGEFERLSGEGQALLQRVADFPKPIIAAIHGACLGGGLELALACHYRICTDHPKTQLGLPEVQLGLLPGAGGCNRLPRLIGARAALDIILAGKSERGQKAFRLGIVDELVPLSILRRTALSAAERLGQSDPSARPIVRRPRTGIAGLLLDRNPLGRRIVYAAARKQLLKKTAGHYPAPIAALEAVQVALERGGAEGYAFERRKFAELAVTDVSRKLIQIFFATTALKKDFGAGMEAVRPRTLERIGVIGSGFMGAGIAGTAALNAGVDVRLKDTELPRVGRGLKAALDILKGRLKRRRITKQEYERLAALISGTTDFSGFGRVDLVVEAVFEDLELKRRVLRETEAATPDTAIFATNTSTIPIAQIAEPSTRPERVLGLHFFSPVDRMPLVEVIPAPRTSAETIATVVGFGRKLGKTVIVVHDSPGFWVNRILTPYMNEAGFLLAEGTPIEVIDRAMTRFGFPVGPITLLDEVGIDVGAKAGAVMHAAFGERLTPADVVTKMIADGRFGRKNGRGFYHYHDGERTGVDEKVYDLLGIRPKETTSPETIEQRLVYAMLNEAAMAESEGVVRSARDGDIGAIFGFGFPPFRGGPLRMIDDLGAAKVVSVLKDLASTYGPRFTPAAKLVEMAASGGKYYSG